MASHPHRNRNPVNVSLTKALAVIKERRRATTENDQLEEWLKRYRGNFEYERKLALGLQDPPSSDSEDELYQPRLPRYLKGAGVVLRLSPEVFYEIFSYLDLEDLLSLSRTCKRFRGVLLSISTKTLWQRAIDGVEGLPPCPSDLSEPQYASLIYSETCSECGKPVFDKMDVNLHVKLCPECQTQLFEVYPVDQHVNDFVPATEDIHVSPRGPDVLVLKRDVDNLIQEAAAFQAANHDASLDSWGNARAQAILMQKKSNFILNGFLAGMLKVHLDNAETARLKRQRQIQQRLVQSMWTTRDMCFSDELLASWDQLVWRKKPINDQAWARLHPKLEALLVANRARNEQRARDGRRKQRYESIFSRLISLGYDSPLLVEATISIKGLEKEYAETMHRCHDWDESEIFKVKAPFPTPASAMSLPIIQNLVEKDIAGSDMGLDFDLLRELIIQDIAAWRTQVERDLFDIWHGGSQPPSVHSQEPPPTTHEIAEHSNISNTLTGTKDQTKSAKRASLPKVQLKFIRADGTTTHDIQELPEALRLLLRADVVFRTQGPDLCTRHCYYPEIVPSLKLNRHRYPRWSERSLGDPWDPTAVARDEDGSRVARLFLAALQLPNATVAEMKAYGAIFQCRRCQHLAPNTWQCLVSHYATEISRFKEAQERIRELGSTVVYNDTHNLGTKGSCFKIIPPKSREYSSNAPKYGTDMVCKICGSLGIKALYRHIYVLAKDEMSPMLEHLANTHGIANPTMDEHFEDPYQDELEDVSEEDDDDDDDDCDTDNSYYGALPTSDELMDIAEEADLFDSDGEYDRNAAIAYFQKKMKRKRY